ncbi:MAG: hypothetical protein ACLR4Z_15925 [Butyricicoccaceae bacterium]
MAHRDEARAAPAAHHARRRLPHPVHRRRLLPDVRGISLTPSIALAGYRAVVEYLFWFFLVTRLIEDDRDFAIFYGALIAMALCIALHGIYQFIIAAPIPASWVSQTEQNVRTRVYSLTGSPNIMGSLLVLFAPMVAGLAYYSRKMWVKVLAVCGTGMMCGCSCIFTFSRARGGGLGGHDPRVRDLPRPPSDRADGRGRLRRSARHPSIANRITYMFTSDYAAASQRAGRMVRLGDRSGSAA